MKPVHVGEIQDEDSRRTKIGLFKLEKGYGWFILNRRGGAGEPLEQFAPRIPSALRLAEVCYDFFSVDWSVYNKTCLIEPGKKAAFQR